MFTCYKFVSTESCMGDILALYLCMYANQSVRLSPVFLSSVAATYVQNVHVVRWQIEYYLFGISISRLDLCIRIGSKNHENLLLDWIQDPRAGPIVMCDSFVMFVVKFYRLSNRNLGKCHFETASVVWVLSTLFYIDTTSSQSLFRRLVVLSVGSLIYAYIRLIGGFGDATCDWLALHSKDLKLSDVCAIKDDKHASSHVSRDMLGLAYKRFSVHAVHVIFFVLIYCTWFP